MLKSIVEEIIQQGILPQSYQNWSELKGGTNSIVGAIGTSNRPNQYVIKSNHVEQIRAESRFYKHYQHIPILPKVIHVDPQYRYIIYEYIPGETAYTRGTKRKLLQTLVTQMIKQYVKPDSIDGYEWVEAPSLVQQSLADSYQWIGSHLSEKDHQLVKDIQEQRSNRLTKDDLYVLHGDFGMHNFLFDNGNLSGVIDPVSAVGRPLYDVLYAFCSTPDDLQLSVLLDIVAKMETKKINRQELIEDTVMALYSRISTCLSHHPHDLPEYLNMWTEWTKQLK